MWNPDEDAVLDVWTDGSRINLHNGAPYIGWGAVTSRGCLASGAAAGGTNINAEVFAVRDAVRKLLQCKNIPPLVLVHMDCQFVLNTLRRMQALAEQGQECMDHFMNQHDRKQQVNYLEMQKTIQYCEKLKAKGISVQFEKSHAHQQELGNSFADYVATQMSKNLMEKEQI